MNDPRLLSLLDRYFDGALSDEDRAELERVLLTSPQGRQLYWQYARLHADVAQWGQQEWGRRMAAELAAGPTKDGAVAGFIEARSLRLKGPSPRRWVPWFVAAAACLTLFAYLLVDRGTSPVTPDGPLARRPEPATAPVGVAVLASSVDLQWATEPRSPGAVLEPGAVLRIVSGAAQIEFYSGARVVLQGPAEFELRSEMEAYCRKGRISAHVPPPARGFTLSSEHLTVVDLGTEFGLSVPVAGKPEVHVFSGEVEVHPAAITQPVVKLTTGQAGQWDAGSIKRVPVTPQSFLRVSEYGLLTDGDVQRRQAVWQSAVMSLRKDPATLVHYNFPDDQFRARTITNLAAASGAAGSSASIVGCVPADGRWPLSRAVEFRGPGDRIRLEVAGSFNAVTLQTWVRFDTLPNTYHALLAPDGLTPGTLRWGVTGDGELRLGIALRSGKPEPNWEVIMTTPVLTPERRGRWVFLASTFDGKAIHHYVDGQLVKAGDAYTPVPVVIGPAEVGNWRGPTPRFIQGRMDEFSILSRAMSAREIKNLYNSGRRIDAAAP